ncbi:MAG: PKD domain-containing protein [Bacteroidales bacterium]|nr:PKD domain-containing protein [Bacteroidales bacterium]
MRSKILFGLFLLLVIWAGCKKDEDSKDLKADFDWTLQQEPGKVIFTNKSSNAISYEWNFDDGTFSTQTNPTKTYQQNGSYIVTLKAFGTGATESVNDTIVVNNIQAK